ncbi:MAG: GNAT family N-acetyltransferase [Nocardioidaceae bacterium]
MPTPGPLITIRELTDADSSAVLALSDRLTIGVAAWRDPVAVSAAVLGWLEASTAADFAGVALVAEIGGRVVGFVSVDTETHFAGEVDAYIGELLVDAPNEGAGVGAALVAAAESVARKRGHHCLTLSTGAANHRAIGFYSSLGFEAEDVKLTKVL